MVPSRPSCRPVKVPSLDGWVLDLQPIPAAPAPIGRRVENGGRGVAGARRPRSFGKGLGPRGPAGLSSAPPYGEVWPGFTGTCRAGWPGTSRRTSITGAPPEGSLRHRSMSGPETPRCRTSSTAPRAKARATRRRRFGPWQVHGVLLLTIRSPGSTRVPVSSFDVVFRRLVA